MVGLLIAIIIFNYFAFKTNKRLTINQIIHIWTFTLAFQQLFDLYADVGYHAYWYFSKENTDWESLIHILFLVPPVNIIFLNYYPLHKEKKWKILYVVIWNFFIIFYEWIALLPAPWGYFHYGWWKLYYSFMINPILFLILIKFYKLIVQIEKNKL